MNYLKENPKIHDHVYIYHFSNEATFCPVSRSSQVKKHVHGRGDLELAKAQVTHNVFIFWNIRFSWS